MIEPDYQTWRACVRVGGRIERYGASTAGDACVQVVSALPTGGQAAPVETPQIITRFGVITVVCLVGRWDPITFMPYRHAGGDDSAVDGQPRYWACDVPIVTAHYRRFCYAFWTLIWCRKNTFTHPRLQPYPGVRAGCCQLPNDGRT